MCFYLACHLLHFEIRPTPNEWSLNVNIINSGDTAPDWNNEDSSYRRSHSLEWLQQNVLFPAMPAPFFIFPPDLKLSAALIHRLCLCHFYKSDAPYLSYRLDPLACQTTSVNVEVTALTFDVLQFPFPFLVAAESESTYTGRTKRPCLCLRIVS